MKLSSRSIEVSRDYLRRAERVIPAVTQTLSKGPSQYVQGVAPIFIRSGQGSHVFDVDGNEYIDYPGALGPVILGYSYPRTVRAVQDQLLDGITFSLMHPLEVEVAELLVEVIPCAEMVRFGKNGSDVTSAAIRAARAYTGREKIVKCGYHGAQDWHVASISRDKGVPLFNKELLFEFPYNRLDELERIFSENPNQIAAVIMEPAVSEAPQDDFLRKVKELAHREGALLVFDEVKSGFRVGLGGAQEYYDVTPDLAAVGKAMGNGMPISAVVGRREVMREFEEVFFSTTFGGEALSLAATMATVTELSDARVFDHIWKQGEKLKLGYNDISSSLGLLDVTECEGLAPKSLVQFRDCEGFSSLEIKSLFQQEVIKRGILFNGEHMISFSHSDSDVQLTLEAYQEGLECVKRALEARSIRSMLEGPPIQMILRSR